MVRVRVSAEPRGSICDMNDPSIPTKSETDCFSACRRGDCRIRLDIQSMKDRRRSLCNSPRTSSQVGFHQRFLRCPQRRWIGRAVRRGIIGAGGNPGDCGALERLVRHPCSFMPLAPSVGRPAELLGLLFPSVAAQTAYMPHPAQPKPAPAASYRCWQLVPRSLPQGLWRDPSAISSPIMRNDIAAESDISALAVLETQRPY